MVIKDGDIVQITDEQDKWFPCLVIVSEVKSWGIQGYVSIPNSGAAYYRLTTGIFVYVIVRLTL